MSKEPPQKPNEPNADEGRATEDLKEAVRKDIEEQRSLIEKLRRKMN